MFTAELRINGTLIGHIYGQNVGGSASDGNYKYEWYEPTLHRIVEGRVAHKRKDGLRKLVRLILEDIDVKCSSAES